VTPSRSELERALLPQLDAGFNLARWLLGNDSEAHDAVQVASVRAIQYFTSFRGGDAKPWFLGIVRNTCLTALRARSGRASHVDVESLVGGPAELEALGSGNEAPEAALERRAERDAVNRALRSLPAGFREALILREMEELSYEAIASVTGAPIGTVMSRLARARKMFRAEYAKLGLEDGNV
jgi:RNA polymerase sigma factor (sigma-70 family)